MNPKNRPIGVFDSGVGGISVLSRLISLMPRESYLYFGDSKNAPYGTKSGDEVRSLADAAVGALIDRGAKAVVIACNTATGAAIEYLREKYTGTPIIGMEPAIKPAAEAFPGGRILVLATPVTLASEKFRRLMDKAGQTAQIVPVPCPELAHRIEEGILCGEALEGYLKACIEPYKDPPATAVVLGCTHYPFVIDTVEKVVGPVRFFDGGLGTARETKRQLALHGLETDGKTAAKVVIENSDPTKERIAFCKRLLQRELR